ncbi:coatomer subunit zeta-2 isoform X4 [Tenrec ecaudatus]|uniref:coatomer subunit zeta-2 isoform X4 n=1 Tax=Tenrec ecaudatus TaxID=94439 RepID=UPI003F5ACEEB
MQRLEAWPRPHPGEGAAAAQAGGPTPPAHAGEPAGPRYYDDTFSSTKEQMAFEKNVFNKTSRTDSEIAFVGAMTIVYKSSIDLFLYVVGSSQENELMLMAVLTCLFESLNHMLRKNVEKRWLLENMDGAFLVLDEIVDGGVILESDAQQVIQKVNFRADDNSLTEQSVAQVFLPKLILLIWSFLPCR